MVYQSNSNAVVSYKVQAGLGTQASGAGGTVLRTAGGNGAKLSKAAVESNEVRSDGMRVRGRHGTQKTASDYVAELSLGSHDQVIEAIMRGTWDSAAVSATQADMTSVTTSANAIIATSGSWITKGFRVGHVVRPTGLPDAANNGRNLRITALTALTMTVAETLVVNAVADTSFTVARTGKVLTNPTSLIKRYFTIDEYEGDIDQSTVLQDFVWGTLKFSMGTNGLIMADPGGIGTGKIDALASAASPSLTSPTTTTGAPMSVVDATIRFRGEDLVELTSWDLALDIGASAPDVFGSGAIKYAPDVFSGQLGLSMNMSMLRKDLGILQDFIGEVPLSLHVLAVDNEAEPKDFMAITVPNFTLGGVDPSALSKQGGGRTQSISIPQALIGRDDTGPGYDPTMIRFQTSAA
jgi:hypothetical protein